MPWTCENSSTNEYERINAIYQYGILDTPKEHEFDNITKLACLICNTPIAVIALVDGHRLWFKSTVGITIEEVPRNISFAEHTIQSDGVFVVNDTTTDPRFADHPSVKEKPNVRFYAGAPLIDENGYKLGAISVFDIVPNQLTQDQKDGLQTLAGEIITHFTLKKKNRELEAKTQRFEELLNISKVSPDIHCVLDFTGKILFINDAVTNLLEYTAEEITGLSMWQFCNKDDINRLVPIIEEGLKKKVKHFDVDFRMVSKSGLIRWLSCSMVTKKNRWYAYGRDITESKRVENELMKLSLVASKINNGVVINDANHQVTWVNAAFEKITGFTLGDLKGKQLGDLIAGPKTDMELISNARERTRQNQSFTVDLLAYRKDKRPIWLSIYNTVILDDEGKVETEVEIIIDITDKKEAEEELQVLSLVASKTNTGVNISDEQGNTTWVNQSLEKLTGYTLEELQGRRLGDVLSNEESQQDLISSARSKTSRKESYSIEVLARTKEGVPIWLLVSNTPIVSENGKVERQIDLITDITQRKQVERELVEAKEQALQLSEAKEMFLSVMSHEIRTPLNAVIGISHLLLDNNPRISQINDLNILKFSSENLLNIINDILDFTKIETGNMKLESIPFSLPMLAGDIINSLQIDASKNGNVLLLTFDERLPANILGDKTRLYQVLMNLLGNAVKFTNEGNITLELNLLEETEQDVRVHFEVRDTGIGIPEDKQSYIFETFTQAKTDISRKYGGSGLGLAITKKLLKLYQSEIEVTSKEGLGTSFTFAIRFDKAHAPLEAVEQPDQLELFVDKQILVVDDNEINIMIANRMLESLGFRLDFASSGEEAIEKIRNTRYDLIFMDVKMPGMDGFETTAIIRGLPGDYYQSVPIIALTASTLEDENSKFKASGMNGHLLKPFKQEEIKRIISAYIAGTGSGTSWD